MTQLSVCCIMNIFYSLVASFANYAYEHSLVTLILSFVIAVILIANVHFSKLLCSTQPTQLAYDYGPERGPHTWTNSGPNQSPINISTELLELWNIHEQLMWNHYNDIPTKVTMENDGRTVIVKAQYAANAPTISGADLLYSYTFESLCFRWSYWNNEGSEHTINFRTYPMEIQATHRSTPVLSCIPTNNSVVIAYLFEVIAHNQFLDPIIQNLHRIRKAGTVIEIPPFPLAWLCYPFKSGFYSYGGSTTTPPCNEGVEWFINSHPLAIGEWQLMEFRSLFSSDGSSRIIRNARPMQYLNSNRSVQFNKYEPAGSRTSCA